MQIIAIQDANILIDCAELSILEQVFHLPYLFKTTDLVWFEITNATQINQIQPLIDHNKLLIVSLNAQEIAQINQLSQIHKGLSLEDCSVWYLAERDSGILLTGDGKLRKTITQFGIEVHGILWVLEQLYDLQLLGNVEACQKIRLLKSINKRLPVSRVEKLIDKWCK